jgi:MFS transporter, DHA1 family, tetracycline resistance protein
MSRNDSNKNSRYLLVAFMLTIVIEVMGVGLVFPLLPFLFVSLQNPFIDPSTAFSLRYLFYGIALATWPMGAFFGAPYLGELSDKLGRKKILILSLVLNACCYALGAISIYYHLLIIFFISRFLSGFFGGGYNIVQAAVSDISKPECKARNLGWLTLAVAIGLIVGPIIASFTTDHNWVSWFCLATPFWTAAGLGILNAILMIVLFKETYVKAFKGPIRLIKIFSSFLFIFTDLRILLLGIIFFLLNLGWGFYVTSIPLVVEKLFCFDTKQMGLFFCVLSFGSIFSILFVQRKLLKLMSLKFMYIFVAILISICLLILFSFPVLENAWILAFMLGLLEVLAYSGLLAMGSNLVKDSEQGKLMGGFAAVSSIAFIVSGITLGILSQFHILLPVIIAVLTYLVSACLMCYVKEVVPR